MLLRCLSTLSLPLLLLLAVPCPCWGGSTDVWTHVDDVLRDGVKNGAFPGCVALVGDRSGVLYRAAVGNYTFGIAPPFTPSRSSGFASSPPMDPSTRFDLASCTKVTATTSAIALLYQDGFLRLNARVSDPALLGSRFANRGKANITVLHCLLHNAGFPPDPSPNYWEMPFGCPQTKQPHPAEDFSCRQRIFEALMNQSLDRAPGEEYVYSDLSFLTLMWVAGKVVSDHASFYGLSDSSLRQGCLDASSSDASRYQCYFEAFVRAKVFSPLGMRNTGFLPPASVWGQCAPAENDTSYQRKQLQGQVSDGNAFALGGIAGHAGVFSTASDLFTLAYDLLFKRALLNETTVELFTAEYNHTQSSRALGWNSNDPDAFDQGWNMSCGDFSSRTFMHLGYTGTMICADPVMGVAAILLTNRCYPNDSDASKALIYQYRQRFANTVVNVLFSRPLLGRRLFAEFRHSALHGGSEERKPRPATSVIPFRYPLFKQCNESWGNDVMEKETICQVGCLMSSVSMSLRGKSIRIDGKPSDPGTLNQWLRDNGGYTSSDELIEEVVPKIAPQSIKWVGPVTSLSRTELVDALNNGTQVVIANVMQGRHFVLITGYDTDPTRSDVWYVNDPGFNTLYYRTSDIVGYRLFVMKAAARHLAFDY